MGASQNVPAGVLSSDASMISLRQPWHKIQPAPTTFDFSYFETQIAAALAVRGDMQFLLLIQTGDGSRYFNGFKPTWLFTLLATNGVIDSTAVVTANSPTVTFSNSIFSGGDVGKRIFCSKLTNNVWAQMFEPLSAYIGVVNLPNSIGISSSPSSNVPLNALGSPPNPQQPS